MTLDRDDVGQRVVVRSLVPGETGPTGGPALTDVLGVLEAWTDDALVVRRADGSVVTIPLDRVVAGKRVPPPPPRRGRRGDTG